ncbi:hypothetical protein RHMOL_Rhmol02G0237200 [Rhododendron molle]|uniref:Uncharacterized protein n=1 Tax=Rhododendron molle TaxID=49168 RepID=A0ACC0PUS5_RHOML|nr:hypothetical protein RHMOL_Rhmol02G0237200 [Rhododendron molle]
MIRNVHFVEFIKLNKHLLTFDQTDFLHNCLTRRALRSERFRLSEKHWSGAPLAGIARSYPFKRQQLPRPSVQGLGGDL